MKKSLIAIAVAIVLLGGAWLAGAKLINKNKSAGPAASRQIAETAKTAPVAPANTAPTQAALPALPTDNKAAIDSEIKGIDQELADIDQTLSATEIEDEELGL